MKQIETVELTIYDKNSDTISIDLSPTQTMAIIKFLGLEYDSKSKNITMFSDESLKLIMDKTINKLKLI
jgi:ribosomal protein L11